MINTNELRLGNFVKYKFSTDLLDTITAIDGEHFVLQSLKEYVLHDDVEGIPLTKKILLDSGFNEKDYKKEYIGIDFSNGSVTMDFVLTKPGAYGEWNKQFSFALLDNRFVNIEYVHQLQNFYFELTRNILNVKIK